MPHYSAPGPRRRRGDSPPGVMPHYSTVGPTRGRGDSPPGVMPHYSARTDPDAGRFRTVPSPTATATPPPGVMPDYSTPAIWSLLHARQRAVATGSGNGRRVLILGPRATGQRAGGTPRVAGSMRAISAPAGRFAGRARTPPPHAHRHERVHPVTRRGAGSPGGGPVPSRVVARTTRRQWPIRHRPSGMRGRPHGPPVAPGKRRPSRSSAGGRPPGRSDRR